MLTAFLKPRLLSLKKFSSKHFCLISLPLKIDVNVEQETANENILIIAKVMIMLFS